MHNRTVMHPAVKLRHIRAFLDIARLGGLTAAARAQGISQPALSRTLAELEALLRAELFRREGRRLFLTEAGMLFRRHAATALQALDAGAAALRPGTAGRVQLGILPTVATRLFPRVALRFREASPEVTLSVATGPQAYLMGLLRQGAIDMVLGRMPEAAEMANLSFTHLYEEEVVIALRADHPMAGAPVTEVLTACPMGLPPEGAIIRRAVGDYLASIGVAAQAAWETVALPVGRGILLGSDAVWFISRGVIAEELARGDLATLPHGTRFLSGAVGITRRQSDAERSDLSLLAALTLRAVGEGLHL
ncbi:MAG TPA: LysR substrate-binding domain-containing protein [Paracoccaceae bacterium]|nr:LysR substrate-binding domain-containing protein [Paracoccaceae bacterium]